MSAPTALYTVGGGEVMPRGDGVRLTLPSLDGRRYADAQVDDYRGEGELRWRPPLRLTLRARFSHDAANLRGTAGFGFWNDPFGMTGRWRLRLPQTVWFFFAAPPSDLRLTTHAPGYGWKAATLDAGRWQARLLVPLAITSTKGWMKRLGRRWKLLHRAVYAAGALAAIHYLWVAKVPFGEPTLYAALFTLVLAARIPPVREALSRLRARVGAEPQRGTLRYVPQGRRRRTG